MMCMQHYRGAGMQQEVLWWKIASTYVHIIPYVMHSLQHANSFEHKHSICMHSPEHYIAIHTHKYV